MKITKLLKKVESTILKKEVINLNMFIVEYIQENTFFKKNKFLKKNFNFFFKEEQKTIKFNIVLNTFKNFKTLFKYAIEKETIFVYIKFLFLFFKTRKSLIFFNNSNNFLKNFNTIKNKLLLLQRVTG